jgi:hypothetical protein
MYKLIEIDGSLEPKLANYIKQAANFIAERLNDQPNILIYVVSSISRDASVIIAYPIDKYKINNDRRSLL